MNRHWFRWKLESSPRAGPLSCFARQQPGLALDGGRAEGEVFRGGALGTAGAMPYAIAVADLARNGVPT